MIFEVGIENTRLDVVQTSVLPDAMICEADKHMERKNEASEPEVDSEMEILIEEVLSDNEELYRRLATQDEFQSTLKRVIDEDLELLKRMAAQK